MKFSTIFPALVTRSPAFLARGVVFGVLALIVACSPGSEQSNQVAARDEVVMDLYKSPTCGCCGIWAEHAEERGMRFNVHHRDNQELTMEKLRRGIGLRYHSCHTAIAADGTVFEGHIPAHLIHQYLAEKPDNAIGLAVPGMPFGSPGMEMGERLDPYDVYLLRPDGSSEVYARVTDFHSQYQ